jgi:M6 family metalloprotease-like protein
MRWSSLSEVVRVDALATNERSVFVIDRDRTSIARFDRSGGGVHRAGRWGGAAAIATRSDAVVYVGDDAERIWSVDPASLDPRTAEVVATQVGVVRALAADDAGSGLLALVGAAGPPRLPVVRPIRPGPLRGSRLVHIALQGANAVTTVARLPRGTGIAVAPDGSVAYVPGAAGTLLAVEIATGATTAVADGLAAPGACAWITPGTLLAVAEPAEDRIVLVDVASGESRRMLRSPAAISGLGVSGDLLVAGSPRGLWSIPVVEADPRRVHLHDPAGPIYRGGYARIGVDVGLSGIAETDLEIAVAGGPEFGMVSASVEHPPNPGSAVVIAGPHPGRYAVEARNAAGGPVVATAEIEVVDYWREDDGPSQAATGRSQLFSAGAAGWGSLWNGVFPWSFTFGVHPVSGNRNVAIVLADPTGLSSPVNAGPDYRGAFSGGVPYQGTTASSAAYFREMSGTRLSLTLAGLVQVSLSRSWGDYFETITAPSGGRISAFRHELIADAVWEAAKQLDMTTVDTVVVVVPSPNGALPITLPPLPPTAFFAWPMAGGGKYMWGGWGPFPTIYTWRWKALRVVVMPAEWNMLRSPDGVLTTLSHELGHTLGMPDLYLTPVRDVGQWDLMSDEGAYPALSLPQRVALGWTPAAQLKTYNFLLGGGVDERVTITAAELTATGPPPGEVSGIVIEVEDGRRYYFEYRSTQSLPDGGPQQIADQQLGANDRRVVGYDVKAGSYTPPIDRGPIIMLVPDDDDQVPGVFAVFDDYEELDPGGNSIFRLDVLGADDDRAVVRVRYGPPVIPTPVQAGPDPSIRPWPGDGIWVSPDLTVTNPMSTAFGVTAIQNGAINTIVARVSNNTDQLASSVIVGFWVKDFTLSVHGPEQFLGFAAPQDVQPNSTTTFSMPWAVPNKQPYGIPALPYPTHVCLVARIRPLMNAAETLLLERSADNNAAQTNITLAFASFSSPTTRTRVPVAVSNPYDDRPVKAHIHVDQDIDGWRTYIERTHVALEPAQTRTVEVMVECLHGQPGHPDMPDHLLTTPVINAAVAYIVDGGDALEALGGGTIEIRPGRATTMKGIDVSRRSSIGRVIDVATGAPKTAGGVLVAVNAADGRELSFTDTVGADGAFSILTPGVDTLLGPVEIELLFADRQNSACSVRLVVP